jgi:hypothetical protein
MSSRSGGWRVLVTTVVGVQIAAFAALAVGGGCIAMAAAADRQANSFAELGIAIGVIGVVTGLLLGTTLLVSLLAYRRGSRVGTVLLVCVESVLLIVVVVGVSGLGLPAAGMASLTTCAVEIVLAVGVRAAERTA